MFTQPLNSLITIWFQGELCKDITLINKQNGFISCCFETKAASRIYKNILNTIIIIAQAAF